MCAEVVRSKYSCGAGVVVEQTAEPLFAINGWCRTALGGRCRKELRVSFSLVTPLGMKVFRVLHPTAEWTLQQFRETLPMPVERVLAYPSSSMT
jgi:hypothetical protein